MQYCGRVRVPRKVPLPSVTHSYSSPLPVSQSLLSFWLQSQFLVPRYLSQTVLCGHWKLWEVLDGRGMSRAICTLESWGSSICSWGFWLWRHTLSLSTSSVHARLGHCYFIFFKINISDIDWAEENVYLSTKLAVNEIHPPAGDWADDLQADDKKKMPFSKFKVLHFVLLVLSNLFVGLNHALKTPRLLEWENWRLRTSSIAHLTRIRTRIRIISSLGTHQPWPTRYAERSIMCYLQGGAWVWSLHSVPPPPFLPPFFLPHLHSLFPRFFLIPFILYSFPLVFISFLFFPSRFSYHPFVLPKSCFPLRITTSWTFSPHTPCQPTPHTYGSFRAYNMTGAWLVHKFSLLWLLWWARKMEKDRDLASQNTYQNSSGSKKKSILSC